VWQLLESSAWAEALFRCVSAAQAVYQPRHVGRAGTAHITAYVVAVAMIPWHFKACRMHLNASKL